MGVYNIYKIILINWFLYKDIPKIPVKIENVSINEGQEANFVCKFISNPEPLTITWYKNETEEIVQTETIIVTNTESTSVLNLKDNKLSDSGTVYSVKITNSMGEALSNKAKLNVSAGPVFVESPVDKSILRDKEVRFECIVRSNPKPTVSWYFNEKELTLKDGVKIEKDVSKDKYSLVIPKCSDKNVGTFTVKAINEFGSDERQCKLDLLDLPKITNKLENITVNEDQSVTFKITFTGKPMPEVKWFRNETEIEITENIEIIDTVNNEVTFIIKCCKSIDHSGSYTAKVYNEFGSVVSNKANLTINSNIIFKLNSKLSLLFIC